MSSETVEPVRRTYRKRRRAEVEQKTRERITAAAVALHGSVGPAATTIKAIAERAGVERATVYRHFPDDEALFDACTAHFYGRHPLPDVAPWAAAQPPDERLRRALSELYRWYAENEAMLSNVIRDAEHTPEGARQRFAAYFEQVHATLMAGRRNRGGARRRVAAALGHAIAFSTWRSLVRERGLDAQEAVALMVSLVGVAGGGATARRAVPERSPHGRSDG